MSLRDWLQVIGSLTVCTARGTVYIQHGLERAQSAKARSFNGGGEKSHAIGNATTLFRRRECTGQTTLHSPYGRNPKWASHHVDR
mmetsp:Transcript_18068/g.49243  ORF Transcript_18068/g.49243 Transcript_18068/m.49243 type:complete len:85 (+) Transcript_18068:5162-5416(+)